jgi:hypothetical protein
MKKQEHTIEVADLYAVAHFEEDEVLFMDGEDENLPSSLCVQANFDTHQFEIIQPMSAYLASKPYIMIDDADTQISYRQRILDEMDANAITAMLRDFNQKHFG